MKRKRPLRALLRDLVKDLGLKELSRRLGMRVTKRTLKKKRLSRELSEAIREVETRRERARELAHLRELKKTRILEDVRPDELARAAGVTLRTARKWIEVGGASKHGRDVAIALGMGEAQQIYPEPKHGKGHVSKDKFSEAADAMREFVGAVRRQETKAVIRKAYRRWRKAKDAIRSKISRQEWAAFIDRMGDELDLPEVGVFSKERFRKS